MIGLIGLLRSLVVYYGHPLRHTRLKRLYREFVRPGDLVIDAGAHAGNHTRAFLALGSRVVAVEPQPLFAWFLGRVFGRNHDATILQTALGAQPGRAILQISSRTPTVSTLDGGWRGRVGRSPSFRNVRWDRQVEVAVDTLDGMIAALGRPAFIKIDAEGSEAEILRGLSAPVPALCFEVLPAAMETAPACIDRLAGLGFQRFNWTAGERAKLDPDWVSSNTIKAMLAGLPRGAREYNIFARCDGL
ncbi:MAG TPA: FkbM family methyltransferase [Anaerolineales bacterium]|nr:FkbM family methyltransferase [Anaerolineales bacterium]